MSGAAAGGGDSGRYQRFSVPRLASQTVLDVVTWIQRHADASLAYRFACRVGMCGSCAMSVNGVARWTCRTHVEKVTDGRRLDIAPLANLPIVRDLVTDMSGFFDKWARAKGQFQPTATRHDDFATVRPASQARAQVDAAIECIGCGVCYASCEVVAWNPDYLGPAALNRAWTLVRDERDGARARAAGGGVRRRRVPRLPHARELHRTLSQASVADGVDRGSQARHGAGDHQGRAVSAMGRPERRVGK